MAIRTMHDAKTGVSVENGPTGNEAVVYYSGLLARSGADEVFLHSGLGSNNNWTYTTTQKMNRISLGFQASVHMTEDEVHFCFRDSAHNWDNNSGQNWSVTKQK